jgi:hypothetical protein
MRCFILGQISSGEREGADSPLASRRPVALPVKPAAHLRQKRQHFGHTGGRDCPVIVVFGTWKARARQSGVLPSSSRARQFSTAKCETRKPGGSLRSKRLPANWAMIPTSLQKAESTAASFSGPDNLGVQRPSRAGPTVGP